MKIELSDCILGNLGDPSRPLDKQKVDILYQKEPTKLTDEEVAILVLASQRRKNEPFAGLWVRTKKVGHSDANGFIESDPTWTSIPALIREGMVGSLEGISLTNNNTKIG